MASNPVLMVTMARCGSTSGRAEGKCGSRLSAAIDLQHRALAPPRRHARAKGVGDAVLAQGHGSFGIGVGHDGSGPDRLTAFEHHALAGQHGGHGHARGHDGSGLDGGVGQRERHLAHAAVDVSPCPGPALERARGVHEMHPRRARVAGPGPGADDPLAVQGGAQPLVAHVVLDDIRDGRLEDDVDGLGVAAQELLDLGPVRRVADPGVASTVAQRAADPVEERLVGLEALHVAGRQLGDGGGTAIRVVPQRDRGAVLERAPQVGVHELDAIATVAQPELVDDQGVQQADGVRAGAHDPGRIGKRLFERAGSPEPVAPLEDEHAASSPGEIGSRGEPVVPAADHHDVPMPSSQLRDRRGKTDFSEHLTRCAPRSCLQVAVRTWGWRDYDAAASSKIVDGTSDSTGARGAGASAHPAVEATEDIDVVLGDGLRRRTQPEDITQGQVRLPRRGATTPTRPSEKPCGLQPQDGPQPIEMVRVVVAGAADQVGMGEQALGLQGPDLPGRRPRRSGQLVDREPTRVGRPRRAGAGADLGRAMVDCNIYSCYISL